MERGMELCVWWLNAPIHSVHDGADASVNTKPVLLQAPSVVFEFSKAFNTRKIADKKQEGAKGKADDEIGSKASEDVSTEESVFGGYCPVPSGPQRRMKPMICGYMPTSLIVFSRCFSSWWQPMVVSFAPSNFTSYLSSTVVNVICFWMAIQDAWPLLRWSCRAAHSIS
jgi:hypothetical protein